jgi:hypothetical protein
VPVTVKMRMGLDDERLTYLEAGRIAADSGAKAVALPPKPQNPILLKLPIHIKNNVFV